MASYENVTFSNLNQKRQDAVREKIAELWADGYNAQEISKRVRISVRSVSAAMGNLTRSLVASKPKTTSTRSRR
jgi:DNA-binding CsgD family transcriptional regulator